MVWIYLRTLFLVMLWGAGHAGWKNLGSKLDTHLPLLFPSSLPPRTTSTTPPSWGLLLGSTVWPFFFPNELFGKALLVIQMTNLTASQQYFQNPMEGHFLGYVYA